MVRRPADVLDRCVQPARARWDATRTANAATCASLGGGGTNWTNPGNGGFSDNLYAQATVDGTITDPLACDDYGFAIPPSAVILGIVVNVERKSNSVANGGSRDQSLRLLKAGVAVGADQATATTYTTTDTVEAHGGSTDLWGTTWTPAEVNAAAFGAVFTATKPNGAGGPHTLTIDQIEIIVYYTDSSQTRAGACTSLGGGGTNWTNPANATASDNAYAQATVDGSTTDPLRCIGYGFAVPAGATILGIQVDVERKSSSTLNGGSRDNSLELAKAGVQSARIAPQRPPTRRATSWNRTGERPTSGERRGRRQRSIRAVSARSSLRRSRMAPVARTRSRWT